MLKALKDFTYQGKGIKAGDVIPPATIEADDLPTLFAHGFVEEDKPEQPAKVQVVKPVKGAKK